MKVVESVLRRESEITGDEEDADVSVLLVGNDGLRIEGVSFFEDEPEDMTLSRSLSDAYDIFDLINKVYDLGYQGINVTFEKEVVREDE